MTKEEIQAMPAGRELDALVAELVMGLSVKWDKDTPCPECGVQMHYRGTRSRCCDCNEWRYGPYREYSDDIAAAWAVHRAMCGRLFSARQRYFVSLGEVVRERIGARVVWPDLLSLIEPADFCRAALRSQLSESPCPSSAPT